MMYRFGNIVGKLVFKAATNKITILVAGVLLIVSSFISNTPWTAMAGTSGVVFGFACGFLTSVNVTVRLIQRGEMSINWKQ